MPGYAEIHTYIHLQNVKKVMAVFNSAKSEELQLYSRIKNLSISNGTLNVKSSYYVCISWITGSFFSGDTRNILKKMSPDLSKGTKVAF